MPERAYYNILKIKKTAITIGLILLAVFFVFNVFLPQDVFAQTPTDTFGLDEFGQSTDLASGDIRVIVGRIVRAILGILGIIAVGIILYAGYVIMTSGGNEEKVTQGKKILINSVIGLAIILSSFTITQFVLSRLIAAINSGSIFSRNGGSGGVPSFDTFSGSGSLGRVIRDHYPFRDQRDVPRNVKIAVTFAEPVDASSLVQNTNGSCWEDSNPANCDFAGGDTPRYGDCAPTTPGSLDWALDCDRLTTSSVQIFQTDSPGSLVEAAALAVLESNSTTLNFIFRPLNTLGSDVSEVNYTVSLTQNIMRPPVGGRQSSIFDRTRGGSYRWQFETATNFDGEPPFVEFTYPLHGSTVDRNSVIQIQFSEPVDPTMVQGLAGSFFNIILGNNTGSTAQPSGRWRITNGYRTVEFVSDQACGQNSCGDLMYCLPLVCNDPNDISCTNDMSALIRTADLVFAEDTGLFEAIPGSGVMDMAGNALDTSPETSRVSGVLSGDRVVAIPHKPPVGDVRVIDPQERAPDNFWWDFSVRNQIDRRIPYIEEVTPDLDAQDVSGDSPLQISFSQVMIPSTLNNIFIQEYPANFRGLDDFWFVPRSFVKKNSSSGGFRTIVDLKHREFGPNDTDLYYFTGTPSAVMSVNQNCLYPGRGPVNTPLDSSPTCVYTEDIYGNPVPGTGANCAPGPSANSGINGVASTTDTGCVQTTLSVENGVDIRVQPDLTSCLQIMQRTDISPPPT